jgi:hypothetical protein
VRAVKSFCFRHETPKTFAAALNQTIHFKDQLCVAAKRSAALKEFK